MVWSEGLFINIFELTHAASDQNGLKPSLEARQNIGAHIIAYDHSIFRVAINMIKRRANNPGARFAHVERFFTGNTFDGRA